MTLSTHSTRLQGRVLLVSAPWPLFNRPSLPLGALKAYLKATLPDLQVDACHLFLRVANALGYIRYQAVSQRVWRAEAVFSALLYPERIHRAESLYNSTLKRHHRAAADFKQLIQQVKHIIDAWIRQVDWPSLDLVGFSISFCQVTASLYLISRIKSTCPSLPIVVGGSSFSGERSANLLKVFPHIDYLVVGEGERPLAELLRLLMDRPDPRALPALPRGVVCADDTDRQANGFFQISRLDRLPVPDYDDYFKMLNGFSSPQRFFPVLPIEASRGCWWRKKDPTGQFRGCAFCNLNLQWEGYRLKTTDQVIREVNLQVRRHQVLSLAFTDNVFPPKHAASIFGGLEALGKDLSIFAELRVNTPPALLKRMKASGVDTVQVGIEALSSRLLARMNKGARAIDNLNLMKHCEAVGIVNASNLILHFPASDAIDVSETLHTLGFVQAFRPLKTVSFWLGLKSPVYRFKEQFQIRSVFNHPNLKKLFPESMVAGMNFMIQGYRGDRKKQQKRWRPVEKKIRQWHQDYAAIQRQTGGMPALVYRDGGRFLIIDQHLPDKPTARHRLTGPSAEIYRLCMVPRSIEEATQRMASHNREQIKGFCDSMVKKRLMFAEGEHYLSLAAPISWRD